MASIVPKKRKEGTSYYISQRYLDSDGVKKQCWIPCKDKDEARFLLDDVKRAEKEGVLYCRPAIEKYTQPPGPHCR